MGRPLPGILLVASTRFGSLYELPHFQLGVAGAILYYCFAPVRWRHSLFSDRRLRVLRWVCLDLFGCVGEFAIAD